MPGFSNITGQESIMYADNASFDGTERGGKMIADGQLWIGASSSPHVRLSTLTNGNNITFTNGPGSITANVTGTTQYAVQVGSAAGALTSVGPGSAGQILQSGGGAANPAYSTATYPSTAGTSGNVLTSDGTNWVSTPSIKFSSHQNTSVALVPADGVTYEICDIYQSGAGACPGVIVIPVSGTINKAYVNIYKPIGTLGSAETSSMYLRKNNSSDTLISSSVTTNATNQSFGSTSVGLAVTAGDFVWLRWVAPTYATNPDNLYFSFAFIVE